VVKYVDLFIGMTGNGIPAGTATAAPLIVMARNALKQIIVGTYSAPVVLTESDKSGITQLSVNGSKAAASGKVAASSDLVTLIYSGANLTRAAISPTATGATKLTGVTFYSLLFGLAPAAQAGWIAVGGDGNLWTTYSIYSLSQSGVAKMTPSGSVSMYPSATYRGIAGTPSGSTFAAWVRTADDYFGSVDASGNVIAYPTDGTHPCGGGQYQLSAGPTADGTGGAWVIANCKDGNGDALMHISSNGSTIAYSAPIPGFIKGHLMTAKGNTLYLAGADEATSRSAVVKAVVSIVGSTINFSGAPSMAVSPITYDTGGFFGIAQSADGDLWVATSFCNPSLFARLHPAATFSSSTYTIYHPDQACAYPTKVIALKDGSLFITDVNWGEITQIIPSPNEGAPVINNILVKTLNYPAINDGVVGPNGDLYFLNASYTTVTGQEQSSDFSRMAY
jgi:hypothetical protein